MLHPGFLRFKGISSREILQNAQKLIFGLKYAEECSVVPYSRSTKLIRKVINF